MYRAVAALALAQTVAGLNLVQHNIIYKAASETPTDNDTNQTVITQIEEEFGNDTTLANATDKRLAGKNKGKWAGKNKGKWAGKNKGKLWPGKNKGKWTGKTDLETDSDSVGSWSADAGWTNDAEHSKGKWAAKADSKGKGTWTGEWVAPYNKRQRVECVGPCCQSGQPLAEPPDILIKMFMSDGCSGSTALMEIVEGLHRAANISFANCHARREVLSDLNNSVYDLKTVQGKLSWGPTSLTQQFQMLVENIADHGQTMLLKEQSDYVIKSSKLTDFIVENGKAAIFLRSNLLDLLLCDIKDGIGTSKSYGTCASCGEFRSRGSDQQDKNEKVILDSNRLLLGLNRLSQVQVKRLKWMNHHFPVDDKEGLFAEQDKAQLRQVSYDGQLTYPALTAEDLFEFEHNVTGLESSVKAWKMLMDQIEADVSTNIIRTFLKERANTRDSPKKHHDLIANIEDVQKAFEECIKHYEQAFCDQLNAMLRL